MPLTDALCPNCGARGLTPCYEKRGVPAHSVLLLKTREEALSYPTGDIVLGYCAACGFVTNTAFEPGLSEYSARYEATQSFSATFSRFARQVALDLIARHDLHGKDILEIGCGQGEFLIELCELGGNRGVGFDPAYAPDRGLTAPNVTFVADFYSEQYSDYPADLVVCKMTLEHIPQTAEFVRMVRRAVGDRPDTVVFFQVPNLMRLLRDLAFWDIYYEHCSYFSPAALAHVFQHNGFEVLDLRTAYDDQYLMLEARPARHSIDARVAGLEEVGAALAGFMDQIAFKIRSWDETLGRLRDEGQRVVVWGSGSKGVAFLTALHCQDVVEYVVDVNPRRVDTFMAGTGQQIVAPAFLKEYRPNTVIVMNPIYRDEIRHSLEELGVAAALMTV